MSELVVIGGGPAGVTAALRARELGAEVILIEGEKLGGTCTNDGCVPTRALAKAARLVRDAEQFADYGLRSLAPRVDFSGVLLSARRVVEEVHDKKRHDGRDALCKHRGGGLRVSPHQGERLTTVRP